MSHRFDCPSESQARYRGERDAEYGRGRYANPYKGECDEASRSWDRGWENKNYEIRREEEAAENRRAEHDREEREWRAAQESAEYEMRYAAQFEEPPFDGGPADGGSENGA